MTNPYQAPESGFNREPDADSRPPLALWKKVVLVAFALYCVRFLLAVLGFAI
jgi:hypothetical protein